MAELRGKRAIQEHTGRAWVTLTTMKEKEHFPMAKVGGLWISDTEEIARWRQIKLRLRE